MIENQLKHILYSHPITKTDIIKGTDTFLFSRSGEKIVDFEAGTWCTALGHAHSRINAAITSQINKLMHLHYQLTSDVAEELAVSLIKLLNLPDGKAVFLSSGSEAVELSMRIAQLVARGKSMLTFSASYLSAYSSTSIPRDTKMWSQVDFGKCKNCVKKCHEGCNNLDHINFDEISAFILEAGNSGGLVLLPPYQLVQYLVTKVREAGGLVIANEVTTGFGRTGRWFGHNHYDITPDVVALGKALGNGYPISAVLMREGIAKTIEEKHFRYAQSHQNDPLGCVIGNEVIRTIKEEKLIKQAQVMGDFFITQLLSLKENNNIIKDVRGRGLMLAVELNASVDVQKIFEMMLQRGYFLGCNPAARVLRFYPALTITKQVIVSMCRALKDVLKEIEK